ncbi:MAG: hypothetical protein QNK31_12525 [Porticoccus sp.]|nr:hypothetical protein [Porticoccus sp.]
MTTSTPSHNTDNVVDLFTGKSYSSPHNRRIIRLAPELDGLEMIYSNESHPEKFFSIKVLCWALRADGEVVGLVPWLDDIMPCTEIRDPLNGQWEGYYDSGIDEVFFEVPIHKVIELETSAEYYEVDCDTDQDVVQELPDTIGTHAVLSSDGFKNLVLKEVVSWRLLHNGLIQGMLIDDDKVDSTPVLPGDECLYPAKTEKAFRYFFQHHIANKIKARDPEALAAISMLVDS